MTNEERAERLLNRMDFDRIENAMHNMNWKWFFGYPSKEQLRDTARDLINSVLDEGGKCASCSTGGLHAIRCDNGKVRVFFAVDEADELDEE